MKQWPQRKILTIVAVTLIVIGIAPVAALYWLAETHNFRPLSMEFPRKPGEYTSPVFKTDLDENYMIQMELMDSTQRAIGLNQNAVLDVDWKIVDMKGAIVQQGAQNAPIRGANAVNLGEYHPKRRMRQKLIFDVKRELEEPEGTHVSLEVNSTDDLEGLAAGAFLFSIWACVVAGPGIILFLVLVVRGVRTSSQPEPKISYFVQKQST